MAFTPACLWKTLVGHLVAGGGFWSLHLWLSGVEENESGAVLTEPSVR